MNCGHMNRKVRLKKILRRCNMLMSLREMVAEEGLEHPTRGL